MQEVGTIVMESLFTPVFFFFVPPTHTFWEQALGGVFFCSFFVCRERERENDSWSNMYVCM